MFEVNIIKKSVDNGTDSQFNCTLEEIYISCNVQTYLDYAVMVLIGINVVGVGGHVDGDRMFTLLTKPFHVTVAMFLRFIILPSLGLGVVELFQLPPVYGLSVLAITAAPHEGITSLFLLLIEGDMTLSLAIMGANNFTTTAFLPLCAMMYEYYYFSSPGFIKLPINEIFTVFGYLCGAASIGYFLRKKCHKCYDKYWEYLPPFTILTVLFIITVQFAMHFTTFKLITLQLLGVSMVITVTGFLIGAATGYTLRQSQEINVVFSIETGVRTTYVTALLSTLSYVDEKQNNANTIPFLVSVLSVIPLFIVVLCVRTWRVKAEFTKYFSTKHKELEKELNLKHEPFRLKEPLCNNEKLISIV